MLNLCKKAARVAFLIGSFLALSNVYASSVLLPDIDVSVATASADKTLWVIPKTEPYVFSGSIVSEGEASPWSYGADIYFGVFTPNNAQVLTWTNLDGQMHLNTGFVPLAQTNREAVFNTGAISYSFSGDEPRGMYLLFLLQVIPNADPNDPSQWLHIGMSPFFF